MSAQLFAFLVAKALLDEQSQVRQERNKERCIVREADGPSDPCACSDCDPGFRHAAAVRQAAESAKA